VGDQLLSPEKIARTTLTSLRFEETIR
jgi:hypothetical protein